MLIYILLILVFGVSLYYFLIKKKQIIPAGYKEVPIVEGAWPIIGHVIQFNKNPLEFIENCRKNYGKIFRVKIFLNDMIIICDKDLSQEFFKAKEEDFSLYKVLDKLFFGKAFSDKPDSLEFIIGMVKKNITLNVEDFGPKIFQESRKFIEVMKKQYKNNNKPVDMIPEMIKFVSCTSARCFTGATIDNDFYKVLAKFTNLLNKIVVLTYFFPQVILDYTLNKFALRKYRMQMTKWLEPEIQKYRKDLNKKKSLLFRKCVDYVNPDTHYVLNDQDIGDIIVCLLYVSSENTNLSIVAALVELARSPLYWDKVKNESQEHLNKKDYKSILNSELIDSCYMEAARLNSHLVSLARNPTKSNATLGEYFVGGVDTISICGPMLMRTENASEFFKNPKIYDPDRFISKGESKRSTSVLNWSNHTHFCPGFKMAGWEAKACLAMVTTNFERFIIDEDKLKINLFSPSAMAEISTAVQFKPLKEYIFEISHNKKKYIIQYFEEGAWLLRGCLDEIQQIDFYNYTVKLSEKSQEDEHTEIMKAPKNKPFPLSYYNLFYTNKSNCDVPKKWLDWSSDLMEMLKENNELINFPINDDKIQGFNPNSMYAQLYDKESIINIHKDEYVDWGISISLASSCIFTLENKTLILHSGDVLIADFSKINHSVPKIYDNLPNHFKENCNMFKRNRMSIQIRDISKCSKENVMTMEEFKQYINKN